jgi:TolB-like protein
MDVLRLLIENAGNVVSPANFLDTIWRSPIATDHAVHKAIAELRSALEDDAHHPLYIKTVPKRGYTLIAELSREDVRRDVNGASDRPDAVESVPVTQVPFRDGLNPPPELLWRRGFLAAVLCALVVIVPLTWRSPVNTPEAEGVVKLAVLPFEARDFTDENQILAEGIRDSLIHGLSKVGHLQVLSAATSGDMTPAGAASERAYLAEADHILQGSVMIADDKLRVFVQMARSGDGLREYSEQFDLPMNDIFAVQDQIASNVVSALSIFLNDVERSQMLDWGTTNPLAYERFYAESFTTTSLIQPTGNAPSVIIRQPLSSIPIL